MPGISLKRNLYIPHALYLVEKEKSQTASFVGQKSAFRRTFSSAEAKLKKLAHSVYDKSFKIVFERLFKKQPVLSAEKEKMIDTLRLQPYKEPMVDPLPKIHSLPQAPSWPPEHNCSKAECAFSEDPFLLNLRATLHSFADVAAGVIQKQIMSRPDSISYIEKLAVKSEEMPDKILSYVKTPLTLLIKTLRPTFHRKLGREGAAKITSHFITSFLLNPPEEISSERYRDEIKDKCFKHLQAKFPHKEPFDPSRSEEIIRSFIEWLFQKEHHLGYEEQISPHEGEYLPLRHLLDELFIEATLFILKDKIKSLVGQFISHPEDEKTNKKAQEAKSLYFVEQLKKQLFLPAIKLLLDDLSWRIADLVYHGSFTDLFDSMQANFAQLVHQVQSGQNAEKIRKKQLKTMKVIASRKFVKGKNKEIQEKAKKELLFIKNQGGEAVYLQKERLRSMSSHPNMHPLMQKAVLNSIDKLQNGKAVPDLLLEKKAIKEEVHLALQQIFPQTEKNRIDFIPFLKTLLYQPHLFSLYDQNNSFAAVLKKIKEANSEAVKEGGQDKDKKKSEAEAGGHTRPEIEKKINKLIEKQLLEQATNRLHTALEELFDPQKLRHLIASTLLPSITKVLLKKTFESQLFNYQGGLEERYLRFFCGWVNGDQEAAKTYESRLKGEIHDKGKTKLRHFNLYKNNFTENSVNELIEEALNPYYRVLKQYKESCKTSEPSKEVTLEEVRAVLKRYRHSQPATKEEVKSWANMLPSLIFDIAKVGNGASCVKKMYRFFASKKAANLCAQTVQDGRRDHNIYLNLALDAIRTTYATEAKMNELLFAAPAPPPSPEETEKLYRQEQQKLADLLYDYTIAQTVPKSTKFHWITDRLKYPKTLIIKSLDNTLEQLFADRILTANFIINHVAIAAKSFYAIESPIQSSQK